MSKSLARRMAIRCSFFSLTVALAATAIAQQQAMPTPRLLTVFPPGGKQGTTVEVTTGGTDLDDATKLLFSDPAITAAPKTTDPAPGQTGPQSVPGTFVVTIKPEAKPGVYECRTVGRYGASNPRAFMVGTYAETLEKESNNNFKEAQAVDLNTTINGRNERQTDEDYFKFTAKKGQRIIIQSWAYRIDSRMDTTLVLYSAAGQEIARNRDLNRRDALLDFTPPADGEYVVKIHDFIYAGTNEYFYRLSIGTGAYIDFLFPPAGLAGSQAQYVVYGRNLPGGQPAKSVTVDGKPLETLNVQIQLPGGPAAQDLSDASIIEPSETGVDAIEYRLDTPQGQTNPVLVGIAESPVVVEQEPNNDPAKAPVVPVPCEYLGQFYPRGDQDWVSFQAKQGEVLWIEVISQRMGLTTDAFLLVQQVKKNDKGEEVSDLQNVDDPQQSNIGGQTLDTTTTDPSIRFVAPAEGQYRVLVKDLYGSSRGDPRYVYRLSIRPAKPDFRLVAVPRFTPSSDNNNNNQASIWSSNVRKGGSDLVDVLAFRRDGFDGDIQVTAEGLPPGLIAAPATIASGANSATLVLTAADSAAEAAGVFRVVGKGKAGDTELTHAARGASMVWPGINNPQVPARSRMTRNLTVAVNASEVAPFTLDTSASPTIEVSRAGTVQIPVKLTRRGEFKAAVALKSAGLPQQFQAKNISVDAAKGEATFEITVPNNANVGNYSVYLLGTAQFQYSRNPEAVKAAAGRKTAMDKQVADLTKASKDAADAKAAAEKSLATARDAEKNAAGAAKAAQDAAAKDAAKEDLAKAKEAAEKAAQEAVAKTKEATDALAAADKAATEAAAKLKDATAQQQMLGALVTDLTNKAKPQNVNVGAASQAISLKVTTSPVAMTIPAPGGPLKKEAKLELPVKIRRIGKFADAVPLKVTLPGNAKGLKAPDVTIAAGQDEAKLVIEAGADAAPGSYKLSVQAQPKLNGQNLNETQEVTIAVE